MTKSSLKQELDKLGVNKNFYSLSGELLPDRMIIDEVHGVWLVFYFNERGNREREKRFSSEDEACKYLYDYYKRYIQTMR